MTEKLTLVIGTNNAGKLHEIKSILGDVPHELRSLTEFKSVETPEESGATYSENAIIKARSYAQQTGCLTLADDSGLEVEVLGGAPGVLSARYAGEGASDADRRALLLSEIRKTGEQSRAARFVCAVAIADAKGNVIDVSQAVCDGRINDAARGSGGFGYDPLFIPEGYEQTFAELDEAVKNKISHRGKALAMTREFLMNFNA